MDLSRLWDRVCKDLFQIIRPTNVFIGDLLDAVCNEQVIQGCICLFFRAVPIIADLVRPDVIARDIHLPIEIESILLPALRAENDRVHRAIVA